MEGGVLVRVRRDAAGRVRRALVRWAARARRAATRWECLAAILLAGTLPPKGRTWRRVVVAGGARGRGGVRDGRVATGWDGGFVLIERKRAIACRGRLRRVPSAAAQRKNGATVEEIMNGIEEEASGTNAGSPNGRGSKRRGSMAAGVAEREALARREVGADTSTRSVSGVSPREMRLSLRKNGYPVVSYSCAKLQPSTGWP